MSNLVFFCLGGFVVGFVGFLVVLYACLWVASRADEQSEAILAILREEERRG